MYFLETENIRFFEANEGVVFAFDDKGKKHLLTTSTLKEIEEQVNSLEFFRISRSELVQKNTLKKWSDTTKIRLP
ncbi:LytTR family DNA-binding domain-containing protein [Chryseobacterium indoltheticum]|uniref:LytTR family DNA-binding domain-containing protein n=1 Tax=Chryseobacterium indoltheticum TaxID=254 RepID=UPI003F4962F7